MTTKMADLIAALDASAWGIDRDVVIVWHSNGDDQLVLASTADGWEGRWIYRDDRHPVGPWQSFPDPAAVLAHLATADPTCVKCGYQGHSDEACEDEPAPGWPPTPKNPNE